MRLRAVFLPPFRKDLRRLSPENRRMVSAASQEFAMKGLGDVARIQGNRDVCRLSVGKWRAYFRTPTPGVLEFFAIENCGEAYRNTR